MIKVTDLHGVEYLLNAEQIEKVERNPDTQILLLNGHRYYVRESLDEIYERTMQYRVSCTNATFLNTADHRQKG